jgi:endonuclease/exonuclease/phosphatase family metal-dependent hydrolase
VSSASTLTVASYNMRKAIGLDRRRDPHRVLDVLHEIDADIVALQEADKRFGGRGSAVPHELIDSHGIYRPVHLGVRHKRVLDKARKHTDRLFKVNTRNIGWHGNAILVKRHIGILDCAALDLPTLEPRGAVMAELLFGSSACTSISAGCGGGARCAPFSMRSRPGRRKCRRC